MVGEINDDILKGICDSRSLENILDIRKNPKHDADNLREVAYFERKMGRNDQVDIFENTADILDRLYFFQEYRSFKIFFIKD